MKVNCELHALASNFKRKYPGTPWIGVWAGPIPDLDMMTKRKNPFPNLQLVKKWMMLKPEVLVY
jgi:hypothetical protein